MIFIFKTEKQMDAMVELLMNNTECCNYQLLAEDSFTAINQELSLTPDQPDYQLLSKFMKPINNPIVQQLIDQYVVLNSDLYSVEEASLLFRRNILCAKTGHYCMFNHDLVSYFVYYPDTHQNYIEILCNQLKPLQQNILQMRSEMVYILFNLKEQKEELKNISISLEMNLLEIGNFELIV